MTDHGSLNRYHRERQVNQRGRTATFCRRGL